MVVGTTHEVYPSAPLRLVAAEIRYPLSPVLMGQDAVGIVAPLLAQDYPLIFPVGPGITFGTASSAPSVLPMGYRLTSRDQMSSVTITQTSSTLETTSYKDWKDFSERFLKIVEALGVRLEAISAVERLGLRYVNEIRLLKDVPLDASLSVWEEYIRPEFLAPFSHLHKAVKVNTMKAAAGLVELGTDGDTTLAVRYGVQRGHTITGSPLRLPAPLRNDMYVLLDMDSYFQPPDLAPFALREVGSRAERLHQPIEDIFDSFVTEQLKSEVFRVPVNA